jgi:integrase
VERLAAGSERISIYDLETPGLALKVETTGAKAWIWLRTVAGKPVWKTIGEWPAVSVQAARAAAVEWNGQLAAAKRTRFREGNPFASQRGEMTLDELVEAYVTRHVRAHANRPVVAERELRRSVHLYLGAWRERRLSEISRKEVIELHDQLGQRHKTTANRTVELLRRLFNFAVDKELWRGANPAQKIAKFAEVKRKRFLSLEELSRLGAALKAEPSQDLADFVLISLWTGARKSDVLSAEWKDVYEAQNRWYIPAPKGGESYDIALTAECVEVFAARRRAAASTQFVFPSYGRSGRLIDLKRRWRALLERAQIADIRQHDLRRSHASWQAITGSSLLIIGKSLGHQSSRATAIYAQLGDLDPVRLSVAKGNSVITQALKAKPKALPASR